MAAAYDNAMAEKERLELQKRQIDGRLAEIDTFIRLHRKFENLKDVRPSAPEISIASQSGEIIFPPSPVGKDPSLSLQTEISKSHPIKGVGQKEFETHLLAMLCDKNAPMTFEEIWKKFADRQISIGGKYPRKNLSSKLWAAVDSGNFINKTGEGYWISESGKSSKGVGPADNLLTSLHGHGSNTIDK